MNLYRIPTTVRAVQFSRFESPFFDIPVLSYFLNRQWLNIHVSEQLDSELNRAMAKAQLESRNGYVQHVCKLPSGNYAVSDWYDSSTVASFENGRRL